MKKKLLTRVLPVVVVLALVVGAIAWGVAHRPVTQAYVTAPAARGDVEQRFVASGEVERTNTSKLTFDTPSTVASVYVKVGDRVSPGQPLAAVDDGPLRLSLLQAQAQLAQAQASLDANRRAQRSASAAPAAAPAPAPAAAPSASRPRPAAGGAPSGRTPTPPASLGRLQASMTALRAAAAAQEQTCAPVFRAGRQLEGVLPTALPSVPTTAPTSGAPTPGAPTSAASAAPAPSPTATRSATSPSASTSGPTPTASSTGAASGEPDPTLSAPARRVTGAASPTPTALPSSLSPADLRRALGQLEACSTAMQNLAAAEGRAGQAIAVASQDLATANRQAAAQLAAAQAQMQKQAEAAAKQAAARAMAQAQAQLAAQAQRQFAGQVTDGTVASDRARVVHAQQAVAKAERDLAAATMTSPISGTVGALDFTAGQSSQGHSVTIVGPGQARVTLSVPLGIRGLVSVGGKASVGLVGQTPTLRGQVTEVSVLPSSEASPPTYTAQITTDDPNSLLNAGSRAEVTLPLRTVRDVVTVPMSAITRVNDTTATVEVVADAAATSARTVTVGTGALGQGRLEVTGLEPGALVVLADRRLPVPGGIGQYQARPTAAAATPTPTRSR